ncbi:cytochrome P450 [Coprinopsis sp. MPI-PUGE-AT-0042]|nr:cytochrome P450 [Coprinopsis sp. MPI-PUGE-AT-0042]
MESGHIILGSCILVVVVERIVAYWSALKAINHHPGHRRALSASSVLAYLTPRIPGILPGSNHLHEDKMKHFERFGWDVVSDVSWFGRIKTTYIVADAAAIREITWDRVNFCKPTDFYVYDALATYGHNIVTTEGEQWRRYKKLTAPAFSNRNNGLVWDETVRVVTDLFGDVWGDQKEITVDHALELTHSIALYVLGAAVFGNRVSWKEEGSKPKGHQLTFRNALHSMSDNMFTKVAVPDWALGLTKQLRHTRLAWKELGMYMNEMLQERARSDTSESDDLLSILLESSKGDKAQGQQLTEEEIRGNCFIFLVAGHETVAHTLCFTFALLALYQDEQEKLYQELSSVLEGGRLPVHEDMPSLPRCMAVFYESLRFFPPVAGIPKMAAEDTTLSIGNQMGETTTIPVPKGTKVYLDTGALHHNPRYWTNPEKFNPDRFLDPNWPKDAFLPFSGGVRACLGRKFFETEGIAVLAMIFSRYKVTIKEEPQFAGETFEQRRARITATRASATLVPLRVPLVFTRRD